jgi:hypothetical protein
MYRGVEPFFFEKNEVPPFTAIYNHLPPCYRRTQTYTMQDFECGGSMAVNAYKRR